MQYMILIYADEKNFAIKANSPYRVALALVRNPAERKYLEKRLIECERSAAG